MIVQKDFNFTEEFFACLPDRNAQALRRAKAFFQDSRIIWNPGTQTWLVLDCLADEHLSTAERQLDLIDQKLTEKPNGPVEINLPRLTGKEESGTIMSAELTVNGENNEEQ